MDVALDFFPTILYTDSGKIMNYRKIFTRRNLIIAAFCFASVFACLSVFSPSLFAQAENSTDRATRTKINNYNNLIGNILEFVQKNYVDEVDPEVLYRGALKGMMEALDDPYTSYLDPSMMRDLNDTTSGNFGGVGLSISKPIESTSEKPAYVEVASPIEDTPGFRSGIQTGDLIIKIDGKETHALSMEEVLAMLRGKVGEGVDLEIRRGKNIEFNVTIVRDIIEVPTVKYGMIDEIGYLRIIEFTPKTAPRVQDAIDSFKAAKFKGLVIDLRNNPGGLITSVADVSDKFIDSGVIVSTKSRVSAENSVFHAVERRTTMPKNVPIVVLINHGSASAAEIFSGALKDYHLAYLVGERTYGKGSVQQPVPLPNSDGIKLTIARYYTPSDTNIDKLGIPPDREIKYPAYTEENEKSFSKLFADGTITQYVAAHPSMTEDAIGAYAKELAKQYQLDERLLRRLIRLEAKKKESAMLYDLDYDIQLTEALKIIRTEDFTKIMKTTKTLKELETEAAAKEAVVAKTK
ncbi:MAG: S41 family peptidase [Treponemataceae bacterium]|nr:MAG: S41 family peptidase [Treponemataceae bacterium]